MADFKSRQLKLQYFLENRNLKIVQNEEDVDCYIYLDKPTYEDSDSESNDSKPSPLALVLATGHRE
jgi:hypothetical protein